VFDTTLSVSEPHCSDFEHCSKRACSIIEGLWRVHLMFRNDKVCESSRRGQNMLGECEMNVPRVDVVLMNNLFWKDASKCKIATRSRKRVLPGGHRYNIKGRLCRSLPPENPLTAHLMTKITRLPMKTTTGLGHNVRIPISQIEHRQSNQPNLSAPHRQSGLGRYTLST
jgi:hypothetical protein